MDVIYGFCCLLGLPRRLVGAGGLTAAGGDELLLAAAGDPLLAPGGDGSLAAGGDLLFLGAVFLAGLPRLLVTGATPVLEDAFLLGGDGLGDAGGEIPANAFDCCRVLGENVAVCIVLFCIIERSN
jgi:hypothetical protein